ncbi:transposase zinc-binding domain-containing protein [Sinorhizobium meliloti]|nr:transposase zinc-binding domain-containing protein [Sinorhizobium meliloti]
MAGILRRHGASYRRENAGHLGRGGRRVMAAIEACRTPRLGGHVDACDDCGLTRVSYNSCRNRHCPKCQGTARKQWVAARIADLLPVPFFHVVFTRPPAVAEIAFQNKAVVYALLMRISAETLQTIAANPRWLGAECQANRGIDPTYCLTEECYRALPMPTCPYQPRPRRQMASS